MCQTTWRKIDDCLRFDQHISDLCLKAAIQLKVLGQRQNYMGKLENVVIVISFISANFSYFPLV